MDVLIDLSQTLAVTLWRFASTFDLVFFIDFDLIFFETSKDFRWRFEHCYHKRRGRIHYLDLKSKYEFLNTCLVIKIRSKHMILHMQILAVATREPIPQSKFGHLDLAWTVPMIKTISVLIIIVLLISF